MTPAEVARVLAKASAFDLRTVGEADVLAWHEVLYDVSFPEALIAVSRHYRTSTERLMPAHLLAAIAAETADRLKGAPDCHLHVGQPAHNCGSCRSERIAAPESIPA